MTDEHWLTLHQANYSPSSRIRGLKGLYIGTAVIVPWLIIGTVICAALRWW
jgi:hypothetical protein